MEITLDETFIGGVLADECAQARRDLETVGPLIALAQSQARHDARLAAAPDAHTLACKAGCFWCCYFTVDVRAVEIIRILDFMDAAFTPPARARVQQEAHANHALLRDADELGRMQRNIKCPFLEDGRCSIYAARPQTCRNYHATSAVGCQQSFEQPDNLDIDPEFAPLVYQAGGAHVDGFSLALREAGYDIAIYELNAALVAALAAPDELRRRFEQREAPFAQLSGATAPLEFADDLDAD